MYRQLNHAATTALVLGAAAVVVGLVRWDENLDGAFPSPLGYALGAIAVLFVVSLVRQYRPRRARVHGELPPGQGSRVMATLVAFFAVGYGFWWCWTEFDDGLLGESAPLVTAGTAVVFLALAVQVRSAHQRDIAPSDTAGTPSSPRVVGAAVAAGAVPAALLIVASLVVVPLVIVDASTAEPASGDPAGVPATVSDVGWRWHTPEGVNVRSVERAGPGVVVRVSDGVVALDGETGEQRWHYRRPGGSAADVRTDAAGESVLVTFSDGEESRSTKVFDAWTGEEAGYRLRQERNAEGVPSWEPGLDRVSLSRSGVVARSGAGVVVWDQDTGEERWRWEAPDDCVAFDDLSTEHGDVYEDYGDVAALPDTIVVAMYCGNTEVFRSSPPEESRHTITVLALDEHNGEEAWRTEGEIENRLATPTDLKFAVSDDGSAIGVQYPVSSRLAWRLFDSTNGQPLTDTLEGDFSPPYRHTATPSWFHFDSEHHFTETDRDPDGAPLEFTWQPNDGGNPSTAELHDYCPYDPDDDSGYSSEPYGRALDDAVLVTCVTGGRESVDSVEIEVATVPWGHTGEAENTVSLELDTNEQVYRWPDNTAPLFTAPGAVVVTAPGSTEVVGLQ